MSSKITTLTQVRKELERFPDYPPRDDMQNWFYLHRFGVCPALAIHLRDVPNAIVASAVPVTPSLPVRGKARIPDLMFVRDGDRELMLEQWGYEIERQGKAPDFVLEIASPTTGRVDYSDKRADYERFGVGEYWRLDPSGGEHYDATLEGDRLVDGVYGSIEIEELGEGRLRGYSEALGLYLCWVDGMLRFFDPVTESYLLTHAEEAARAAAAEARAEVKRADRIAELEAELRRLRGE